MEIVTQKKIGYIPRLFADILSNKKSVQSLQED